LHSLDS